MLFRIWMREFFEVVACYQSLLLSASFDTSAPSGGLEESFAEGLLCCIIGTFLLDPLIMQHSCHKKTKKILTQYQTLRIQ